MKRDPLEIMEQILNALECGRPFSMNELAKETGIHNITIKRYVQIIERVHNEPHIEVIKTRNSIIVRIRR
ncbi:MAG: HTH domain-containing protein [Nanoarchaeota archaeon]